MKKRNKQLTYALRENLERMAAYGESKYAFRQQTNDLRRRAKNEMICQHKTSEEIEKALLHIDAAKDKIFSYGTMRSYIRFVADFAEFVASKTGTSRTSVEDSVQYIQPFVNHLIIKGDSPSTINLKLSAVCKATGQYVVDYSHPERRYADVTRGVKPAVRDNFNSHRAAESLELNRAIGLRRSELGRVTIFDVSWDGEKSATIRSVGKGGKHNETYITDPAKLEILTKFYCDAIADARATLLTKEQMQHDADLHHARAMCAIDEYNRVMSEIKGDTAKRDEYKRFIVDFFAKHNKPLRENLDKPYFLRGAGKAMQESRGREFKFDRVAVLYVSATILHHFRSDTTIQHYLIK